MLIFGHLFGHLKFEVGHLKKFISNRMLYDARLMEDSSVADMIEDGKWKWPDCWYSQLPILKTVNVPTLQENVMDCVKWRNKDGKVVDFTVKNAWLDLREQMNIVNWSKVVWFAQCNPRCAFILWMAIHGKLSTQDRIMKWKSTVLLCPLCNKENDSHSHLFFKCEFSKKIWEKLKGKLNMKVIPDD